MPRNLRMLAACEMSGRVATEFAKRGWEAWSADLLASEKHPCDYKIEWSSGRREITGSYRHYQGDVRDLFSDIHSVNRARLAAWLAVPDTQGLWDLVIAFPPCTHLSLAGARYWKAKREPQLDPDSGKYTLPSIQDEAAEFFMEMVNAPARHVAVENPRGDMTRRYRPPDQYVQPWWFGDPLRKQTGLWLANLPLLYADSPVIPTGRVATGGGSHRTDVRHGRGASNGHEDGEGRKNRQVVRNRTLPGIARAMADQWGSYIEKEAA